MAFTAAVRLIEADRPPKPRFSGASLFPPRPHKHGRFLKSLRRAAKECYNGNQIQVESNGSAFHAAGIRRAACPLYAKVRPGAFCRGVMPGIAASICSAPCGRPRDIFGSARGCGCAPGAAWAPRALAGGASRPLPGSRFLRAALPTRRGAAGRRLLRAGLRRLGRAGAHCAGKHCPGVRPRPVGCPGPAETPACKNWVWNHMMDSTHACIYVTDPETDEILFMNGSMKRAFGLSSPEGQICWKVLQQGQTARCPFCPVQMLLQERIPTPMCGKSATPSPGAFTKTSTA